MFVFRHIGGQQIGSMGRVALCGMVLFLISGFALAWRLEPDPRGFGTHSQLGLPPCTFLVMYARPCPGCGMTTSFTHFVRGHFVLSARANPAGLVFALASVLLLIWSVLSLAGQRLLFVEDPIHVALMLIASLGGAAMLTWGVRLVTGWP